MPNDVTINGVDYSSAFIDYDVTNESIYKASKYTVLLVDIDNSIDDTIERFQEIKIYEEGTLFFTGVIIDIDNGENNSGILEITGMDYWMWLLRSPHTESYTAQTASQIITDMVNNNEYINGIGLTTTGIVATTNTLTKKYLGRACSNIAVDLAVNEDFVIYIDKNKDVKFRSNIAVDSGIHLNYANNDMKSENIKRTGLGIVNVCRVRGKAGSPPNNAPVSAIYEDDELIAKYKTSTFNGKLPMLEINAPELTTPQDCLERAIYEIRKRNEDPKRGTIVASDLNINIVVGELITLTIASRSIIAETFIIQSVTHIKSANETSLEVIYYTRSNADLVQDILERSISSSQYLSDEATVFNKFKILTEPLLVTSSVDVDRRSYAGAEYGEFDYSDKYYGQVSGSWTSVVSAKQTTVTNKMFETLLRIIGQISTIPNQMDGANANIAIGTGTTTIPVTSNTLENETFRKGMEPGYPNKTDDKEITFRTIIGDDTVITTTIANIGMFNDPSIGNEQTAIVLDSSISKVADEEIRITWKFTFSGTVLTTAGINLLRDLYTGFDANFLDNSNASIEITTTAPSTYREGMVSGKPDFPTTLMDMLRFQIDISGADVDGAGIDGETFTEVDLYNKTSGGIKVIDGVVGTTNFNNLQNLIIQILLKMIR